MVASFYQPGDMKSVKLVSIGGKRHIKGGNGIADGPVGDACITTVMERIDARKFGNSVEEHAR